MISTARVTSLLRVLLVFGQGCVGQAAGKSADDKASTCLRRVSSRHAVALCAAKHKCKRFEGFYDFVGEYTLLACNASMQQRARQLTISERDRADARQHLHVLVVCIGSKRAFISFTSTSQSSSQWPASDPSRGCRQMNRQLQQRPSRLYAQTQR